MCEITGQFATLKTPYLGYRNIVIVEQTGAKWMVEICGSGKLIEVWEDEFTLDKN